MTDKEQILEVELKYNIYDEYKVSTLDGAIPRDLSLTNKNVFTLEKLKSYAGKLSTEDSNLCRTLFKWGDMEWFGDLLFVDVEYTSFFRWGDPLKVRLLKLEFKKNILLGLAQEYMRKMMKTNRAQVKNWQNLQKPLYLHIYLLQMR